MFFLGILLLPPLAGIIAIIPARGGSKRIPRKNIADFCGSPMISYSINAAKNSKIFDRVVVLCSAIKNLLSSCD